MLSHADFQIKSNSISKVMRTYEIYMQSIILLKCNMKTNTLFTWNLNFLLKCITCLCWNCISIYAFHFSTNWNLAKIQMYIITWNIFHTVKINWGQQYHYYKDIALIILYFMVDTFQHRRDFGSDRVIIISE